MGDKSGRMRPIGYFAACLASFVLTLVSLSARTQSARADSLKQPLPGALKLERTNVAEGPIIVKLRMEHGEEILFRVDTGAAATFLDESIAPKLGHRLGITNKAAPFGEATSLGIYSAPRLYAGDTPLLVGPRVYTQRLVHPGEKGILGMDCLRHYCIQFDFKAGKMLFLEPEALDPSELGTPFPLKSGYQGVTYFEGDLFAQGKMRFMLDTAFDGRCDAMIDSKVFNRLARKNLISPIGLPDMTFPGGTSSGDIFPKLKVLGQTYTDLHFYRGDLSAFHVKGVICMRFLARHRVTLNYPKNMMHLKYITSAPQTGL